MAIDPLSAGLGAAGSLLDFGSNIFGFIGQKRSNEATKSIAFQQTKQAQILADATKASAKTQAESIKTILVYLLIIIVVFVIGWIVVKTVSNEK